MEVCPPKGLNANREPDPGYGQGSDDPDSGSAGQAAEATSCPPGAQVPVAVLAVAVSAAGEHLEPIEDAGEVRPDERLPGSRERRPQIVPEVLLQRQQGAVALGHREMEVIGLLQPLV